MPTLHFEIDIQAPREKVWRTTLFTPNYERWTTTFCEGSRYEGSWDAGSRMRFMSPSGDGMLAEIVEHRQGEFVSIRHVGAINQGAEDTDSEAVRAWAPCFENYTFTDIAGGTCLRVDCDVFGTYEDWMRQTWPKALLALKSLCEQAH